MERRDAGRTKCVIKSLVRSSAVSRGVPLIDKMQIRDGTRVMRLSVNLEANGAISDHSEKKMKRVLIVVTIRCPAWCWSLLTADG